MNWHDIQRRRVGVAFLLALLSFASVQTINVEHAAAQTACTIGVEEGTISGTVADLGSGKGIGIISGCDGIRGTLHIGHFEARDWGGYNRWLWLVRAARADGTYTLYMEDNRLWLQRPYDNVQLGTLPNEQLTLTYDLTTGTVSGTGATSGGFSYSMPSQPETYAYDGQTTRIIDKYGDRVSGWATVDFRDFSTGVTTPPPTEEDDHSWFDLSPIVDKLAEVAGLLAGLPAAIGNHILGLFWDASIPAEIAAWVQAKTTTAPVSWFTEVFSFLGSAIPDYAPGDGGCATLPGGAQFCPYTALGGIPGLAGFISLAVWVWATITHIYLVRSTWQSVRN